MATYGHTAGYMEHFPGDKNVSGSLSTRGTVKDGQDNATNTVTTSFPFGI